MGLPAVRTFRSAALLAAFGVSAIAGGLFPAPALAQEGGDGEAADDDVADSTPEDLDATREARAHFESGLELFEARQFRRAIREFHLAAQRVPSADLWFNIARAHEELSEYEQAIEYYRRYLRDRVDPPDEARIEVHIEQLEDRAEAQRRARRTAPTTGTLRVRVSHEGAAVQVDGRDIGRSPMELPLTLSPGGHRLVVRHEGHVPFVSDVRIVPGVTTGAFVELEPATEYRAVRGDRIFTWVAGGLAVAALGTSIYFGAQATGRQADDDLDGARTAARRSDYALGAAMGLALTAVVLWFVEGRSVGTERVE